MGNKEEFGWYIQHQQNTHGEIYSRGIHFQIDSHCRRFDADFSGHTLNQAVIVKGRNGRTKASSFIVTIRANKSALAILVDAVNMVNISMLAMSLLC